MSLESKDIPSLISDMNSTSLRTSADDQAIYHRLPNELLIPIFENALTFPRTMNEVLFMSFVSKKGRLGRFLAISKWTYPLVLNAFYRMNNFHVLHTRFWSLFERTGLPDLETLCSDPNKATSSLCPPIHVRPKLAYLEIDIRLTSSYDVEVTDHPDYQNFPTLRAPPRSVTFMSVEDLTSKTKGWNTLRNLTNEVSGYSSLTILKLNLALSWCFENREDTEIFHKAIADLGIRISAGRIEVTYSNTWRWKALRDRIQWVQTSSQDPMKETYIQAWR